MTASLKECVEPLKAERLCCLQLLVQTRELTTQKELCIISQCCICKKKNTQTVQMFNCQKAILTKPEWLFPCALH